MRLFLQSRRKGVDVSKSSFTVTVVHSGSFLSLSRIHALIQTVNTFHRFEKKKEKKTKKEKGKEKNHKNIIGLSSFILPTNDLR